MQMDALEEMARSCFGYGRWEAPYWFIGLEEGMSGTLEDRIEAWRLLGSSTGLTDCRDFHHKIKDFKWHCKGAELQRTWRVLILLLLSHQGIASDKENIRKEQIRDYQCTRLGRSDGEIALIELFGLPAKDLKAGLAQRQLHFSQKTLDSIYVQRRDAIHGKIRRHKPSFVVMYGADGRKHFEILAGRDLKAWDIFKRGNTVMTFIPHPTSHGVTDERWMKHALDWEYATHADEPR